MKKNILILLLIIVVPIKIYSFDYYKNLLDNLFSYYSIGYRDNQNINKQGSIVYTGKESDFSIIGNGFFKVLDKETNRTYFTRNGNFILKDNKLYTVNGFSVVSNNGMPTSFCINSESISSDDNIFFSSSEINLDVNSKIIKGTLELSNVYPKENIEKILEYILENFKNYYFYDDLLNTINEILELYIAYENNQDSDILNSYICKLEINRNFLYSIIYY